MIRRLIPILCATMLLTIGASAQQWPTTRPAGRMPMGDGMGRMSPDERAQIEDFVQEHMPNLYRLARRSAPWRRRKLMGYAATRMITYNQAINDQTLADKVSQDLESEDEVFAITDEIETAAPADRPALQQKLTDKMREVIDNLLQERTARLERLKQKIEYEEKRLNDDRANRDEIVEDRVNRLIEDMPSHDGLDGHYPTTAPTTAPAK
jgi:hypothetical protein